MARPIRADDQAATLSGFRPSASSALTSVGLPGLNGFIGEFLCLAGVYQFEGGLYRLHVLTALGVSGMVLGAWYLFTMLRKLLFGPTKEPHHEGHAISDLKPREWALLVPIIALIVLMGVLPNLFLRPMAPSVERMLTQARRGPVEVRADGR